MKSPKTRHFLRQLQQKLQLSLNLNVESSDLPHERLFRSWVWQTCKNHYRCANIGIFICDETEAATYNSQYRHKPNATNVLSFPLNDTDTPLQKSSHCLDGDLIFCHPIVIKEALEQHKSIQAHYAHLTIHGTLHLMGLDHLTDDEATIMESTEIHLLNQLGYTNPYLIG